MRARLAISAFVFLGAVLLFSLEPMSGRLLLPHFGGAFHVWTTALMFFQGALFVGYLYAHLAAERLGRWHLLVVLLPLAVLPIGLGDGAAAEASVPAILAQLTRHVALPFGVLATTAVLAQCWLRASPAGTKEPWSLYAVSNAGSLGALLAYAFIIEPFVGLETQRRAWTALYVVYIGSALLAWHLARPTRPRTAAKLQRPPARTLLYWILLSAAPSAFLGAVTNLIALEAGSIPLVWVVPLAIYLGSFVLAFAPGKDGTRVPGFVRRLWPHVGAVGLYFFSGGDAGDGWITVVVHLAVLAFICLAAHDELYRARPEPRKLTLYYLVAALGGWLGGAFVALLAPRLFRGLAEYPIAVCLLLLTVAVGRRAALDTWLKTAPKPALLISAALVLVIVGKVGWATLAEPDESESLAVVRSYYGLYRVTRAEREDGAVRDLISGNTRHGRQREGDLTPLSYYHPAGPLGDAMAVVPSPRRVGVVGLGVGAATGYLEARDHVRFFEIDPSVLDLAQAHFTYLSGSRARADVVLGDARLTLEDESRADAARYDLLFVDAFAGDAVPTHLLTVEAFRVYLSRLQDDGLLLLHVSNRFYDLRPVLAANARALGLSALHVARLDRLAPDQDPSLYVAIATRPERLAPLQREHGWSPLIATPRAGRWTDDHVNILEALPWP